MSVSAKACSSVVPFDIRPLSDVMGGEVEGFDLSTLSSVCERTDFLSEVCRNGLLVFHDQNLSAQQFGELSRFCGELEFHVLDQYRLEEVPEIYVISNIVENGKSVGNPKDGFGWHTDQSYLHRPTAYTLLHGVETPAEGADTLFASTEEAYGQLDPELKARIDGMKAVHSYVYMRTGNADYMRDNGVKSELTAAQREQVPDVVHPLVRTHPLTGRKSLYLGGDCIVRIEGMEYEESRALLDTLFAAVLAPANQIALKWRPGDVVIWDNRTTMHSATDYDRERYRRLIWRTSVKGEVPT
ncbi:TauD/TfdA family dioxygenase [Stappia sp. BW2]|uniref:TauD/TfdA dioxygenase family protein n=1 Tax=Stappia sp. BW2 TaxID=2592622 RepID=UPI0011DED42B|nr:TauD/TfdA family dioxygenase [Stappia sp. BW2]TYC64754.1 TauD/TfdA family dioxygenase [Stappia sp. BW2]